jgi:predicted HicB family RNase H-like nuclease
MDKREAILQTARRLFDQGVDWVVFYREIMGLDGLIRQTFITTKELTRFEKSDDYRELQGMLTKLRERPVFVEEDVKQTQENREEDEDEEERKPKRKRRRKVVVEPDRVITVRLPRSLHESLRDEAYVRKTSMNKLCISKLLQFIDGELVPEEKWAQKDAGQAEAHAK